LTLPSFEWYGSVGAGQTSNMMIAIIVTENPNVYAMTKILKAVCNSLKCRGRKSSNSTKD